MSEYQTQIGHMCKVLNKPCKDYDEFCESFEVQSSKSLVLQKAKPS